MSPNIEGHGVPGIDQQIDFLLPLSECHEQDAILGFDLQKEPIRLECLVEHSSFDWATAPKGRQRILQYMSAPAS